MKKIVLFTLMLLFFIISPIFMADVIGQPPPPTPEAIPIDGGLGFLLLAGMAYGARKLYQSQDKENA